MQVRAGPDQQPRLAAGDFPSAGYQASDALDVQKYRQRFHYSSLSIPPWTAATLVDTHSPSASCSSPARQRGLCRCKAEPLTVMNEFRFFACRIAPSGPACASLEFVEIAAGGNFAIALLRRQPHFEVVSEIGAESKIAAAKRDLAIRQFQHLQHSLGMTGKLFQRRGGILRSCDLHEFDFLELVLADHALVSTP